MKLRKDITDEFNKIKKELKSVKSELREIKKNNISLDEVGLLINDFLEHSKDTKDKIHKLEKVNGKFSNRMNRISGIEKQHLQNCDVLKSHAKRFAKLEYFWKMDYVKDQKEVKSAIERIDYSTKKKSIWELLRIKFSKQ